MQNVVSRAIKALSHVLWLCVCDRLASGAIPSVVRATVKDCRSVLHVFTLSRTAAVLPSAHQITMLVLTVAAMVGQINANAAVLDV